MRSWKHNSSPSANSTQMYVHLLSCVPPLVLQFHVSGNRACEKIFCKQRWDLSTSTKGRLSHRKKYALPSHPVTVVCCLWYSCAVFFCCTQGGHHQLASPEGNLLSCSFFFPADTCISAVNNSTLAFRVGCNCFGRERSLCTNWSAVKMPRGAKSCFSPFSRSPVLPFSRSPVLPFLSFYYFYLKQVKALYACPTCRFRGLGPEEMLIYQLIEKENNTGPEHQT